MIQEEWRQIPEFPQYEISNFGNVYNRRADIIMRTSKTNHGHTKISLLRDRNSERCTRSVAHLVAEAFVEAPNLLCDQVVVLDGNYSNVAAENLTWRPAWFAWKYARQLKVPQPMHYHNLAVYNVVTDVEYNSIIEAGMTEGLLFKDIWRSTYTGEHVYPNNSIFEILK